MGEGGEEEGGGRSSELVERHAHADVGAFDHLCEFFEADLAVAVEVGFHDCLVDDLVVR